MIEEIPLRLFLFDIESFSNYSSELFEVDYGTIVICVVQKM